MTIVSVAALGTGLGTFLLGLAAILRSRIKPGDPVRLDIRAQRAEVRALRRELALSESLLEDARRDLREARVVIARMTEEASEAKTLIIALRQLVPGGDWLSRLLGAGADVDTNDTP